MNSRSAAGGLLISGVVVLVCAAMPWFTVSCAGEPIATQTGYQSALGSISMAPQLEAMAGAANDGASAAEPERDPYIPTLAGLAAAVLAALMGLIGLSGGRSSGALALVLALVAAAGISWAGFKGVEMDEPGGEGGADAELAAMIKVERYPGLWGSVLGAWGQVVCAGLLLGAARKEEFDDDFG